MQNDKTKQNVIAIAGMHRSGTSLTAALLQNAGVNIGQRLMGTGHSNVKGHFENLDFVEFHEDVLYSHGLSKAGWTLEKNLHVQQQYLDKAKLIVKQNSSNEIWGWKDPRTTLFLNFWADFIPEAKFLLLYRSPWEVVDSIYRRGDDDIFYSNPNFPLKLWIHYNQIVLNFYKKVPERCLLLNISSLVKEPSFVVKALKEKFGISLPLPDKNIYESKLFGSQTGILHRVAIIKHYFREAIDLYYELNAKALHLEGESEQPCFGTLQVPNYQEWVLQDWLDVRRLERQQSTWQQTKAELERCQSQLQQAQATITGMESSTFWKLRKVWFKLKQAWRLEEDK